MGQEAIEQYARERNLSNRDALQTFMQIIVLKNLSLPKVRLIGGTALVLGHGNPRFSEDVDLAGIASPTLLRPGLAKAAAELEGWLGQQTTLVPPKKGGQTWRLVCSASRSERLQLHIDCQEYPASTAHPIILQFPTIPSFVFETASLGEIMADKVIAVAYRRYLGGRDLFDLWFHWLQSDNWKNRKEEVQNHVEQKLKDRSLPRPELVRLLKSRLSFKVSLERARTEWKRYLPRDFQRETVQEDMVQSSQKLLEIF